MTTVAYRTAPLPEARYAAARELDGCNAWVVIDTAPFRHRLVADGMTQESAERLAAAASRHEHTPPGDPVLCPDCGSLLAVLR